MEEMNLVLLISFLVLPIAATPQPQPQPQPKPRIAKPNCSSHCGDVEIPFPFGLTKACSFDESFLINCNNTLRPPQPIIDITDQVQEISLSEGFIRITQFAAVRFYDKFGREVTSDRYYSDIGLDTTAYSSLSAQNLFTAIGCDTLATIDGIRHGKNYTTGCISVCDSLDSVTDGVCNGIGCCQIKIPEGSTFINYTVKSFKNHTEVWDFNPCGYAFVVDGRKFNFTRRYLANYTDERFPMVLDLAVKNETCESAADKKDKYACKSNNSKCFNRNDGLGYLCRCSVGFEGNPYLPEGCQDINECNDPRLNNCTHTCTNTMGSYECSCRKGYEQDGEDCIRKDGLFIIKIAAACGISFVAAIVGCSWFYFALKKRKLIQMKEEFFRKNGGFILQQRLSTQGCSASITIFSITELENATNKFDEKRVIGKGGCGTVFKGFLIDNRVVAIKRSMIMSETQIESFINELIVLSQVNHKSIVKLLGCCLETQVPLLVYEYVLNGTLYSYIHNEGKKATLSWEHRLRITTDIASALSYLHYSASTPIIHRDVKSTNILLDENYTAKVSDFGLSRLVPADQIQLATIVQGTLGYIDPEYVHTSQFTEKSDVYSFGVVLVELLTGKKAISFDRSEAERNLAMLFLSYLKKDRLFEVLDNHVAEEGKTEELKDVVELARKCLSIKGEERPTMKEVAIELEVMMGKNEKHSKFVVDEIANNDPFPFVGDDNTTSSSYNDC